MGLGMEPYAKESPLTKKHSIEVWTTIFYQWLKNQMVRPAMSDLSVQGEEGNRGE